MLAKKILSTVAENAPPGNGNGSSHCSGNSDFITNEAKSNTNIGSHHDAFELTDNSRPAHHQQHQQQNSSEWTEEDVDELVKAVEKKHTWLDISTQLFNGSKSVQECIERWEQYTLKLSKGHWRPEEDMKLVSLVREASHPVNWREIAKQLSSRSSKQCRERWSEYLDPSIDSTPFSVEEDELIINAHAKMGNKWKEIAELFVEKRRTATAVKVRWNCLNREFIKGKVIQQGTAPPVPPPPPQPLSSHTPHFNEVIARNRSSTDEEGMAEASGVVVRDVDIYIAQELHKRKYSTFPTDDNPFMNKYHVNRRMYSSYPTPDES